MASTSTRSFKVARYGVMRSTVSNAPRASAGASANAASTRSVNSLPAAPPSFMRSFTPRYSAGLWLLVSMMPPTASASCATDQHSVGVGQ